MTYKDKQCKGCGGIEYECIIAISLEYEEATFDCPCIDCVVKVLCRADCVLYNQYLNMAKVDLIKGQPERLSFLDTVVARSGTNYYRSYLCEFTWPWDKAGKELKELDEKEKDNMVQ